MKWHNKASGSHIGGPQPFGRWTAVNDNLLWFRVDLGQTDSRQSSISVTVINQHDQTLHFSRCCFFFYFGCLYFDIICTRQSSVHHHIGTRCGFLQISDTAAKLQFCSVPWLAPHRFLLICDVFLYVPISALLWYRKLFFSNSCRVLCNFQSSQCSALQPWTVYSFQLCLIVFYRREGETNKQTKKNNNLQHQKIFVVKIWPQDPSTLICSMCETP